MLGVEQTAGRTVASQVEQRLKEMRVYGNLAEVARQSGVSDATWRAILNNKPPKLYGKRQQIQDYLGWPHDGIEQAIGGRAVSPRPKRETTDEASVSAAAYEELRGDFAEMRAILERVLARMEQSGDEHGSQAQR